MTSVGGFFGVRANGDILNCAPTRTRTFLIVRAMSGRGCHPHLTSCRCRCPGSAAPSNETAFRDGGSQTGVWEPAQTAPTPAPRPASVVGQLAGKNPAMAKSGNRRNNPARSGKIRKPAGRKSGLAPRWRDGGEGEEWYRNILHPNQLRHFDLPAKCLFLMAGWRAAPTAALTPRSGRRPPSAKQRLQNDQDVHFSRGIRPLPPIVLVGGGG
jgi:hypothetical protein